MSELHRTVFGALDRALRGPKTYDDKRRYGSSTERIEYMTDAVVAAIGKSPAVDKIDFGHSDSRLPEWVKPGVTFRYNMPTPPGNRNHGRVFHIRGIVDGNAVIREWWRGKQRWNYTIAEPEYFKAFADSIVVETTRGPTKALHPEDGELPEFP